jgi:hypothetical protein
MLATNPLPTYFGVELPHPDTLRTGDLLLPRSGKVAGQGNAPSALLPSGSAQSAPMRRLLEARLGPLGALAVQRAPDPAALQALLDGYQSGAPPTQDDAPGREVVSVSPTARRGAAFDLDDPATLLLLLRVMSIAFADLLRDWLEQTPRDFVRSALGRFLLETLRAERVSDGFFVGHVALVLREQGGQTVTDGSAAGQAYVIEANTTDYSHYRVALHPYHHAPSAGHPDERQRIGWADRRAALGEKVWLARPQALQAPLLQALADEAKVLLGRPYGFFDHPTLGDVDRLYCSEFVHAAYARAAARAGAGPRLDDCCNWGWVCGYLQRSGQTRLQALTQQVMQERGFDPDRRFFVLSPPMVWASGAIGTRIDPVGEGEYAPRGP